MPKTLVYYSTRDTKQPGAALVTLGDAAENEHVELHLFFFFFFNPPADGEK